MSERTPANANDALSNARWGVSESAQTELGSDLTRLREILVNLDRHRVPAAIGAAIDLAAHQLATYLGTPSELIHEQNEVHFEAIAEERCEL